MIAAFAGAALSLCINDAALALPDGHFTIEWQHSVEHVSWHEDWQLMADGRLALIGAAVKGSGAGMEAGPEASLIDGWWRWRVAPPVILPDLLLGASGATESGWRICDRTLETCLETGAAAQEPVLVAACAAQD